MSVHQQVDSLAESRRWRPAAAGRQQPL